MPTDPKKKSKRLEVKIKGKTYWYDQQQEIALTKFMSEKKKMLDPMIEYMKQWIEENKDDKFYDAKLLQELMDYPESVREEFGVTTAREGKIVKPAKMKDLPDSITKTEYLTKEEIVKKYGLDEVEALAIDKMYPFGITHDEMPKAIGELKTDYTMSEFSVTLKAKNKKQKREGESLVSKMIPIQNQLTDLHFKMQQQISVIKQKEKDYDEAQNKHYLSYSREESSKIWKDYYTKYPLGPGEAFKVEFKDPYYPFPKPGELYACGKQEVPPAYKNQMSLLRGTTPLGQVQIHGTGGDFDVDTFKELWHNTPFGFKSYSGFLDMGCWQMKFSDRVAPTYGTYPRRMLLLL